jgi:YegS/Rv2252/BmrU family lipid kinase
MVVAPGAQICLLVNPVAGGGRAGRRQQAAVTALRGHGLEVRTVSVDGIESVSATAASAAATGEIVVVLGGDGMARAAAAGLGRLPGSVMGIIPAGRGNDLARVLEIPTDPAAACAVIANGVSRAMDLGEVNGRPFVGIASVGFDSNANHIANLAPAWMGSAVYAYGAARALMSWRPATFALELLPSRQRIQFTGYSVAFANSRCFGGGMRLAPEALLDDGQLDVVLIKKMARARYAWHLPKVFRGRHVGLDVVGMHRTTEAVLSADRPFTIYADGDPIGELPARIRTVPRAIAVLTDPAVRGAFSVPDSAGAGSDESPGPPAGRAPVVGAAANGAAAGRAGARLPAPQPQS